MQELEELQASMMDMKMKADTAAKEAAAREAELEADIATLESRLQDEVAQRDAAQRALAKMMDSEEAQSDRYREQAAELQVRCRCSVGSWRAGVTRKQQAICQPEPAMFLKPPARASYSATTCLNTSIFSWHAICNPQGSYNLGLGGNLCMCVMIFMSTEVEMCIRAYIPIMLLMACVVRLVKASSHFGLS